MKKIVYVVNEENLNADSFDLFWSFDLEEALKKLSDEADRGYRLNKKNPSKTTYSVNGYEIELDELDEDTDLSDAKNVLHSWMDGLLSLPDPIYYNEYKGTV